MPGVIGRASPSRVGKKQVIAFLHPGQVEAAYRKARREEKTNQEVMGEALNAVCASYGLPPVVAPGHRRIVRRKQGKARMREDGAAPACRAGRHSYAAWFDESEVSRLKRFSCEVSVPVQEMVERGLWLITGVAPGGG